MQSFSSSKIPIPVGATSSAQITHTASSTGVASSPAASGYFVDQRKGEVNELKQVRKPE